MASFVSSLLVSVDCTLGFANPTDIKSPDTASCIKMSSTDDLNKIIFRIHEIKSNSGSNSLAVSNLRYFLGGLSSKELALLLSYKHEVTAKFLNQVSKSNPVFLEAFRSVVERTFYYLQNIENKIAASSLDIAISKWKTELHRPNVEFPHYLKSDLGRYVQRLTSDAFSSASQFYFNKSVNFEHLKAMALVARDSAVVVDLTLALSVYSYAFYTLATDIVSLHGVNGAFAMGTLAGVHFALLPIYKMSQDFLYARQAIDWVKKEPRVYLDHIKKVAKLGDGELSSASVFTQKKDSTDLVAQGLYYSKKQNQLDWACALGKKLANTFTRNGLPQENESSFYLSFFEL